MFPLLIVHVHISDYTQLGHNRWNIVYMCSRHTCTCSSCTDIIIILINSFYIIPSKVNVKFEYDWVAL